ncbi:MAG: histidine phosphatase family protein [Bacteroidota bacterium]|jgi:phosphohistidine phosphatase
MKQLFIIRHAKSSWDNMLQKDFDRTLNERGMRDAPAMAKRLVDKGIIIDKFVSSTAVRAFTTATFFAKAYHQKESDIIAVPELYHAGEEVFYKTIRGLDNSLNSVALFSHNPGITYFVNTLTNSRIDEMPTCGIFAIQTPIEKWEDFEEGNNKFWFFDYPKNV